MDEETWRGLRKKMRVKDKQRIEMVGSRLELTIQVFFFCPVKLKWFGFFWHMIHFFFFIRIFAKEIGLTSHGIKCN